ncbi:MAG: AMP-binding protein [Bosea sp.]|uniref:phenylacetate--CoA ligase family protein n=1 Tax=unclassified Bosea (in: a-proteobacteria) TaxID=2653178 RepID=UPI00096182D8|nr:MULTISPECIES: AMP-binding protein [unclassified Bosea (in: a-proteobacteria)]MBN9455636.1 AMP-binding protein [Bosea sp. (in: a-proteobacteria)]OJV05213.1 MAG: AMP-dependent synthetase [Bosea sp. 67-29]
MTEHHDALETRSPAEREADLFARLPKLLAAAMRAPAYAARLAGVDPAAITDRAALASLPILRKADLPALQREALPFGGLVPAAPGSFGRLFTSPGPIFEPEGTAVDAWGAARGLRAAGFRPGDIVLNTLSYHLTPGGFIMDSAARALGCAVIPAGPGNTEQQMEVIAAYRPSAYAGTPDFLKILIEAADARGVDISCIRRAVVSGAAFPPSLQAWVRERGIDACQLYATADIGVIAYETSARDGMVLNEDLIVEIVRPGTGDPVPEGEVGEVVVTNLDPHHPQIRLAVGDLTAVLPGASPCGRTNTRIRGWLGRADQTAKIKGMFVRPEQVAEIARRHAEIAKLRLVVGRADETDTMTLRAEIYAEPVGFVDAVSWTLQQVTKLKGKVEVLPLGALPNDGKVIADERPVG